MCFVCGIILVPYKKCHLFNAPEKPISFFITVYILILLTKNTSIFTCLCFTDKNLESTVLPQRECRTQNVTDIFLPFWLKEEKWLFVSILTAEQMDQKYFYLIMYLFTSQHIF